MVTSLLASRQDKMLVLYVSVKNMEAFNVYSSCVSYQHFYNTCADYVSMNWLSRRDEDGRMMVRDHCSRCCFNICRIVGLRPVVFVSLLYCFTSRLLGFTHLSSHFRSAPPALVCFLPLWWPAPALMCFTCVQLSLPPLCIQSVCSQFSVSVHLCKISKHLV